MEQSHICDGIRLCQTRVFLYISILFPNTKEYIHTISVALVSVDDLRTQRDSHILLAWTT